MSHEVLERTARESYGRLVAWLAAQSGDLQRAEDALSDALQAALVTWPERGVPDNPEAWLLTAARRRTIDRVRRAKTRHQAVDTLRRQAEERASSPFAASFPDRRLELLFVCAHPDVPEAIRTPLMLQVVLGWTAERIGSAWLVAPTTMGQRLSRAKRRLKEARVPFELPPPTAMAERLTYVLDAVYAATAAGFAQHGDEELAGLGDEALWLCQLLVQRLPREPEVLGLYALVLFTGARRRAQRVHGAYVPLDEQDPAQWHIDAIEEAERALRRASHIVASSVPPEVPGPYQLEAAIQSVHCDRRHGGPADAALLLRLYRVLVEHHPTIGAYIGYSAACDRAERPADGLAVLDQLEPQRVRGHAPYWAVRGQLLRSVGDVDGAREALRRAAGLTADPAQRDWLLARARA